MKRNNVIEINGKLYDARSGAPVYDSKDRSPAQPTKAQEPVRSMDGIAKQPLKKQSVARKVVVQQSSTTPIKAIAPAAASSRAPSAPHHAKLKPKRSLTLNRSAVVAPAPNAEASPHFKISVQATSKAVQDTTSAHMNLARVKRASHVAKSPVIQRFNTVQPSHLKKKQVAPTLTKHFQQTHHAVEPPAHKPAAAHLSTKEHLIKSAVKHATSASDQTRSSTKHKKQKSHHFRKYAPAMLVFLLLSGYVAYLNVPSISMKVAAHRAGFAATMPGYKPAGYSLRGPIAYSPGQVSVNFASNTDDRNFSLKQQPTTWDSTALLENLVTKKTSNYLTYQDRGLTIYIFDDSSAAWVNGGKLYQVEGNNSRLDTDQLLKLATSV